MVKYESDHHVVDHAQKRLLKILHIVCVSLHGFNVDMSNFLKVFDLYGYMGRGSSLLSCRDRGFLGRESWERLPDGVRNSYRVYLQGSETRKGL